MRHLNTWTHDSPEVSNSPSKAWLNCQPGGTRRRMLKTMIRKGSHRQMRAGTSPRALGGTLAHDGNSTAAQRHTTVRCRVDGDDVRLARDREVSQDDLTLNRSDRPRSLIGEVIHLLVVEDRVLPALTKRDVTARSTEMDLQRKKVPYIGPPSRYVTSICCPLKNSLTAASVTL